jgi:hypothetical protein
MKLYWSYASVPELARLPKRQQERIWLESRRFRSLPAWYWLSFVGLFAIAMVRPQFVLTVPNHPSLSYHVSKMFNGGITGISISIWWLVGLQLLIASALPEIRKRATHICGICGYDLRATPDRCPECGTPVVTNQSLPD